MYIYVYIQWYISTYTLYCCRHRNTDNPPMFPEWYFSPSNNMPFMDKMRQTILLNIITGTDSVCSTRVCVHCALCSLVIGIHILYDAIYLYIMHFQTYVNYMTVYSKCKRKEYKYLQTWMVTKSNWLQTNVSFFPPTPNQRHAIYNYAYL